MTALDADEVLPGIAFGGEVDVLVDMVGAVCVVRGEADQVAGRRRRDAGRRDEGSPSTPADQICATRGSPGASPAARTRSRTDSTRRVPVLMMKASSSVGRAEKIMLMKNTLERDFQRLVPVGACLAAFAPRHRVVGCEGKVDGAAGVERDLEGLAGKRSMSSPAGWWRCRRRNRRSASSPPVCSGRSWSISTSIDKGNQSTKAKRRQVDDGGAAIDRQDRAIHHRRLARRRRSR